MPEEQHKIKLHDRLNDLKRSCDRSKIYLQELDAERQKTINDILIITGRILELEEILKEPEPSTLP